VQDKRMVITDYL